MVILFTSFFNVHIFFIANSLFSLLQLQNLLSNHPIIQRIHIQLNTLSQVSVQNTFIWIPSHVGIPQHDKVDSAAKKATLKSNITIPILSPINDLKFRYKHLIISNWHHQWHITSHNKLRTLKENPYPWKSSTRNSRSEEVIITRLIGHAKLTHSYILCNQQPPLCPHCLGQQLTIDHIFTCLQTSPLHQ